MHSFSPQLTLGLSLRDEATFENFYPGSNQEISAVLQKMASGSGERSAYVCGTRGQGLSHLLQACCHAAAQLKMSSAYLPLATLRNMQPEILDGFERMQLLCIDDLQSIAGNQRWEEAIFNLFNRVYDANAKIVFAANDLPKAVNIQLPDLVSRLSWGVVYQLHPLTDQEKINALTMRATRRGINLSNEVARFIMTHCPRHMGTLFAALDALDKASLAAQRRLTIPFVKEILMI